MRLVISKIWSYKTHSFKFNTYAKRFIVFTVGSISGGGECEHSRAQFGCLCRFICYSNSECTYSLYTYFELYIEMSTFAEIFAVGGRSDIFLNVGPSLFRGFRLQMDLSVGCFKKFG